MRISCCSSTVFGMCTGTCASTGRTHDANVDSPHTLSFLLSGADNGAMLTLLLVRVAATDMRAAVLLRHRLPQMESQPVYVELPHSMQANRRGQRIGQNPNLVSPTLANSPPFGSPRGQPGHTHVIVPMMTLAKGHCH